MNLEEVFESFKDDYLKFDAIEDKFSHRPDLHAFILLDRLCPDDIDMICGSEHDEFWLSIDKDVLSNAATEEQIHELVRCGVRYNVYDECLVLFT